jgi:hypothetical protein
MTKQRTPTWGRGWTGPYEGPFTLALKAAWANLPTRAGTSALFDGQSFGGNWQVQGSASLLLRPPESVEPWMDRCLSHYAGEWTFELASDQFFRYCPDCLQHGYQASIYQVQALRLCPIHLCELKTTCARCGASTCSYSLNAVAFGRPFHCWRCDELWIEGLSLRSISDTDALHKACKQRLSQIYLWLSSLQKFAVVDRRKGPWKGGSIHGWYRTIDPDCRLLEHMGVEKRHVGFWIATRISPLPVVHEDLFIKMDQRLTFASIKATENLKREPDLDFEHLAAFIPIYKSIRRHVVKRHLTHCGRRIAIELPSAPGQHMPRKTRHLLTPCVAMWRRRFELAIDFDFYKRVRRSWSAYLRTDSSLPNSARKCRFFYASAFLKWYSTERDLCWPIELLPSMLLSNFYSLCNEVAAILDESIDNLTAQQRYCALNTYEASEAVWQHANLRQRVIDLTDFYEQVSGPYFGDGAFTLAGSCSQSIHALAHSSRFATDLARIWA